LCGVQLMARRNRIAFVPGLQVGSGYWLHYPAPEREDGGQGAVVGHEVEISYHATLAIAKVKARRVMADPEVAWAVITKPVLYARRMPRKASTRGKRGK
jgi:hypothetical protein